MSKFRYFKMQELNPEEVPKIVEQFNDNRLMYDMFRLCHNTYVRLDEDLIKALYVPLDYNDGEYYEREWLPYESKLFKQLEECK